MRSLLPTRGYVPKPTKALLTLLILGSLFLPAPFVILAPGDPQNVLGSAIKISGTQTYPTTGKLSVTAVMITDPDSYITAFDIFYGWVDKNRAVLPRERVYPDGETAAEAVREGAAEMSSSQVNATAAALSYLGYQIPSKLMVVGINEQTNAYQVVLINDQILSIDQIKLNNTNDLLRYLDGKKAGEKVSLEISRIGVGVIKKSIDLSPREDESAFIGINIQEQFDFPLGIVDKLTQVDLIRSRNIAGTGTIATNGLVGPIGGIAEKIIGAQNDGVDLFFTPINNCQDINNPDQLGAGQGGKGMKIVPVATLAEAIEVLKLPENAKLPSCKSYA
jgi:PDZ domain-containing protein